MVKFGVTVYLNRAMNRLRNACFIDLRLNEKITDSPMLYRNLLRISGGCVAYNNSFCLL